MKGNRAPRMTRSWKPDYAAGFDTIDGQHMTLFSVLDELNDVFRGGNIEAEIRRVLRFLVYYCEFHFEDEERVFREAGVADLEDHIREHRLFLARVYDLNERWEAGERTVVAELVTMVQGWLTRHIAGRDVPTAKAVRDGRERQAEKASEESADEPL